MSILNTLYEAKANRKLISIYSDESDWSSFSIGYVHII